MVRFQKSFRNYAVGDVAGFSKQHEAWLISKNIAEKFDVKAKQAEVKGSTDPSKIQGSGGHAKVQADSSTTKEAVKTA